MTEMESSLSPRDKPALIPIVPNYLRCMELETEAASLRQSTDAREYVFPVETRGRQLSI